MATEKRAGSRLTKGQVAFVDDLATLIANWNMPRHAARLYGYLQLSNEPASLDDIARDLEISRTNAHAAATLLESHGNARRLTVRGTKRILYIASEDPGAPLRRPMETLGAMARLIDERRGSQASGVASDRLKKLARFHSALAAAMKSVLEGQD